MSMLIRTSIVALLLTVTSTANGPRFDLDTPSKIVRVSDPAIAPDGRSVAIVVSRANLEENRYDPELVQVDIATKSHRVLSSRRGLTSPVGRPMARRSPFLQPSKAARSSSFCR